MKRAFGILLITLLAVAAWQSYQTWRQAGAPSLYFHGALSDIADEVVAVPLENVPGQAPLARPHAVREEGSELFLIDRETIYRYRKDGRFVCRVTDPADIRVAGYLVNPAARQLIVMGNTDDIFYYTYDGCLVEKKKLKSELPDRRLLSVAYHRGRIWSIEEALGQTGPEDAPGLYRQVVEYDTAFRRLDARPLVQADLGRDTGLPACFFPQLAVAEDTGQLYACQPQPSPEHLLRDTLYLKENHRGPACGNPTDRQVLLYPLRFGRRLWLSAYGSLADAKKNYLFCYDILRHTCRLAAEGFRDNFYRTGLVCDLEPMDLAGRCYSFARSGKALAEAFPAKAASGQSVIFLVKLKG